MTLQPDQSSERPAKHYAFLVEVPALYTADLDELRQYDVTETAGTDDESEFLLNCCGEPGVVRLRMYVSGEKDGAVVEVWGSIREAKLVDPSRGYELEPRHLTDDQLAKYGDRLMRDDFDGGCEWCSRREEQRDA